LILKDILSPFSFNKPIGFSPKAKLNIQSDIASKGIDADISIDSIYSSTSTDYSSIITDTPISNRTLSPKILSPIKCDTGAYDDDDENRTNNLLEEL